MKCRIYGLRRNPKTSDFLINVERFCPRSFHAFDDWAIALVHKSNGRDQGAYCLSPLSLGLVANKSYGAALVWSVFE